MGSVKPAQPTSSGEWNTRANMATFKRKPAENPRPRSARIVSGKRSEGATVATSVCITPDEKLALKALMAKTHMSGSDLLRQGLQKVLSEDRHVVPPSIGIVNGIYPATINDDVVALSNAVVALGYVVELLEGQLSRPRRLEARKQLAETIRQLQRIAGLKRIAA